MMMIIIIMIGGVNKCINIFFVFLLFSSFISPILQLFLILLLLLLRLILLFLLLFSGLAGEDLGYARQPDVMWINFSSWEGN